MCLFSTIEVAQIHLRAFRQNNRRRPSSNIVNVSLGAQRVMTLRMKKDGAQRLPDAETGAPRPTQRIPLPHNSMFVLGPETNKKWLHGINHDNRPLHLKDDAERIRMGSASA